MMDIWSYFVLILNAILIKNYFVINNAPTAVIQIILKLNFKKI